jgi:hypothetical protein
MSPSAYAMRQTSIIHLFIFVEMKTKLDCLVSRKKRISNVCVYQGEVNEVKRRGNRGHVQIHFQGRIDPIEQAVL